MFSKQHYKVIANMLITACREELSNCETVKLFAGYFERDNPAFDKDNFIITICDLSCPSRI